MPLSCAWQAACSFRPVVTSLVGVARAFQCQWLFALLQAEALGRIQDFMQWLTQLCCDSLYPGAAHARCHFAIHCLQVVLLCYKDDRWLHLPMHSSCGNIGSSSRNKGVQKKFRQDPEMLQHMSNADQASSQLHFDPLTPCIRSSESFVQVQSPVCFVPCFTVPQLFTVHVATTMQYVLVC